MKVRRSVKQVGLLGAMLAMPVLVAVTTVPANAAPKARPVAVPVLEAWPGQRVIFLLPLQLGAGWNVDPVFGKAILDDAEQRLKDVLQRTNKFSVVEAHRYNPILVRAVQDKRITSDQMNDLVQNPSVENARIVLAKLDTSFDQQPLIGEFALEEVRVDAAKDGGVQVQISAKLYELGGAGADKTTVVTSDTVSGGARNSAKVVGAATNAFATAAAEFIKPLDVDELIVTTSQAPEAPAEGATAEAPATAPAAPAPAPVPANTVVLPGDVPIAGSSTRGRDVVPQLPAAQPPLGINVPNTPTAGR